MNDEVSINMAVVNEMLEMLGEDLKPIYEEFKDEIPSYLKSLKAAHEKNEIADLIAVTHTVKSSSANLGFEKLSMHCQYIEESLRTDATANIAESFQVCLEELQYLDGELASLMQTM